ncbi:MAG: efflux RND transporter permease subunit, partial [Bacteriovoracaceae bacterium]|nr:efflux RND transporter permease subunit [Bacteriovoracaceae bacterium]
MIDFFLKRSFIVNVIMIFVVALGVWGYVNIPRTVLPFVEFNRIRIELSLPGASPVELEKYAVFPIENAIRSLGLPTAEITSRSEGGKGRIQLGFFADFDRYDDAINKIKTTLDG